MTAQLALVLPDLCIVRHTTWTRPSDGRAMYGSVLRVENGRALVKWWHAVDIVSEGWVSLTDVEGV